MSENKKSRSRRRPSSPDPAPQAALIGPELKRDIEGWAEEACEAHEMELVDVEIITSGRWIVRVYAQRPGNPGPGAGITIEECVQISRYLEALLDAEESMPEAYALEVSSPGIERPLKRLKHFEQVVGSRARLVLREAVAGSHALQGVVREVRGEDDAQGGVIVVELEGGERVEVPLSSVKKAHVVFDFKQS